MVGRVFVGRLVDAHIRVRIGFLDSASPLLSLFLLFLVFLVGRAADMSWPTSLIAFRRSDVADEPRHRYSCAHYRHHGYQRQHIARTVLGTRESAGKFPE